MSTKCQVQGGIVEVFVSDGPYRLLLALAGGMVALFLTGATGSARAQVVPEEVWIEHQEFSVAQPGQSLTHEFVWTNSGSTPVKLRAALSSCECLRVLSFPKVILPREVGRIEVVATPKNPGPIDWIVTVETDDTNGKERSYRKWQIRVKERFELSG